MSCIQNDEKQILQCGIIGAGIAGPGAAIALRRGGHYVDIFKRLRFKTEIGAAITLTPNSNLILERWNFDFSQAGEIVKWQLRRLGWQSAEPNYQDQYDGVQKKYGHAFNGFHRVDLHNGLRQLAEESGVELRLGSELTGIDCSTGNLTMRTGSTVQKDVIVVADGSKVRPLARRTLPILPNSIDVKSLEPIRCRYHRTRGAN